MGALCCGEEETFPSLPLEDDSLTESLTAPIEMPAFIDYVVRITEAGRLVCERKRVERNGRLRTVGFAECDIDTPLQYRVTLVHQVAAEGTARPSSGSIDMTPLTSAPPRAAATDSRSPRSAEDVQ